MPAIKFSSLPDPPSGKQGWPWVLATAPSPPATAAIGQWPSIAVVTPSYQQGEFLEETIRSVLLQNYPNLQYIVIDGGSTDASLEILQRYGPWLSFWTSERDSGQSDAIRKGFAHVNCEIWNWLNSDDLLQPGALFALAEAYKQDLGATLYTGRIEVFGGQLHINSTFDRFSSLICIWEDWPISQQATYLSTAATREVGGVNVALRYAMDYELYVRLALRPDFRTARVPASLARFRLHADSKTCKEQVPFKEEILAVFDRFAQANPDLMPKGWQRSRQVFVYHLELDQVEDDAWDFLKISWRHFRVAVVERFFWSGLARAVGRIAAGRR